MIDLKLTPEHDLLIENGGLILIDGVDQIIQKLKIRLLTFLGEYIKNIDIGVPYFQEIFVKNPNITRIEAIIKQKILEDTRILEILTFSTNYDPNGRTIEINFSIKTSAGDTDNIYLPLGV